MTRRIQSLLREFEAVRGKYPAWPESGSVRKLQNEIEILEKLRSMGCFRIPGRPLPVRQMVEERLSIIREIRERGRDN